MSIVSTWLKKDGNGYQTRASRVLREKMLKDWSNRDVFDAVSVDNLADRASKNLVITIVGGYD